MTLRSLRKGIPSSFSFLHKQQQYPVRHLYPRVNSASTMDVTAAFTTPHPAITSFTTPHTTATSTKHPLRPSAKAIHRRRSTYVIPRATIAPERPSTATFTRTNIPEPPPTQEVPGLSEWHFTGPPLSAGPRPSVIYLALTSTLSLTLDPFNQFVTALTARNPSIRIFSPTLPLHSPDMAANDAVFHAWRAAYVAGGDVVSPFVRNVNGVIDSLVANGIASPRHGVHLAGLSRGGLLCGLVAAQCKHVRSFLAFAPVTSLQTLSEFESDFSNSNAQFGSGVSSSDRVRDKIAKASLLRDDVVNALVHVPVRVYMGNMDTRVGTRYAFEFAHRLAQQAAEDGVRSPPHEFIMYSSIGRQGHGTPTEVFEAGADYVQRQIEAVDCSVTVNSSVKSSARSFGSAR